MATIDDNSAAIRIQAAFRGYYIRKLNMAYKPGDISCSKKTNLTESILDVYLYSVCSK